MSRSRKARPLEVGDRVSMRDGRAARIVLLDRITALVHAPEGEPGQRYVIVPRDALVRT